MTDIESQVRDYYGRELQSSEDLKTNACCTLADYPEKLTQALGNIHEEVLKRYYGCGLAIPSHIGGLKVLDLGSGAGRDCYLLAQLVGEKGSVLGIDMTPEQLDVARRHQQWHQNKFGYKTSNVDFVKGNIQDLAEAHVASDEYDLIVSNCVVNLATDKRAVLSEAFRVLKQGGEFYFADVYCDRRVPDLLAQDPELYGECLGGALYWNDFLNLAKDVGFSDPRIVESRPICVENESVASRTAGYRFYAVTHRLFKLDSLEFDCEDYGQAVVYHGGIDEEPEQFRLDHHHLFTKGQAIKVCGNTWRMLAETRYRDFFEFQGSFEQHYGIFPGCGTTIPYQDDDTNTDNSSSACC